MPEEDAKNIVEDDNSNPFADSNDDSISDLFNSEMSDEGELIFELKNKEDDKDNVVEDKEDAEEVTNIINTIFKEPDPEVAKLEKENEEVKSRLKKLELEKSKEEENAKLAQAKEKYRTRLEEAGFAEEQINFLVEDKFKSLEKEDEDDSENKLTEAEEKEFKERLQKETMEVIAKYDGKKAPHYSSLEPYVNYLVNHFESDLEDLSLVHAMRVAENVPFMLYLEKNEDTKKELDQFKDADGKFSKLSLKDFLSITENFRRVYYKQKGKDPNSYDHLMPTQEENKEEKNKTSLSNNDVERLINAKKENVSVPGGSVESSEDKNERNRPLSAKESVERAFNQAF